MEQLPWDNRKAIGHYGKFVVPWWAMCFALLIEDWKVVPSKRSNTYYQYTSIGHPPLSVPKRKKMPYILVICIAPFWRNNFPILEQQGTTHCSSWHNKLAIMENCTFSALGQLAVVPIFQFLSIVELFLFTSGSSYFCHLQQHCHRPVSSSADIYIYTAIYIYTFH